MPFSAPASPGSGSITVKQVEVDFGTVATRYFNGVIVDADVSPASLILLSQSGDAPTGKSQDENEMDPLLARAAAASGSFVLNVTALEGPVVGKFKINYLIGSGS